MSNSIMQNCFNVQHSQAVPSFVQRDVRAKQCHVFVEREGQCVFFMLIHVLDISEETNHKYIIRFSSTCLMRAVPSISLQFRC